MLIPPSVSDLLLCFAVTCAVPKAMHKTRAGYTSDQAKKGSVSQERRTFWITSMEKERKGKEGKNSA